MKMRTRVEMVYSISDGILDKMPWNLSGLLHKYISYLYASILAAAFFHFPSWWKSTANQCISFNIPSQCVLGLGLSQTLGSLFWDHSPSFERWATVRTTKGSCRHFSANCSLVYLGSVLLNTVGCTSAAAEFGMALFSCIPPLPNDSLDCSMRKIYWHIDYNKNTIIFLQWGRAKPCLFNYL